MSSAGHSPPRLYEEVQAHPESVTVAVSATPGTRLSWVATLLGRDDKTLTEVPFSDSAIAEHALSVADTHLIAGGRPRTAAWSRPEDVDGGLIYRASLTA